MLVPAGAHVTALGARTAWDLTSSHLLSPPACVVPQGVPRGRRAPRGYSRIMVRPASASTRPAREARCARRASSSCGGRGWGGTPRGPCCHRLRHTRAEHRYGGSWQEGGARAASPPLQGLAPPARRPRAAGAPWEARARAARVQTAGEDLVVVVVVVVVVRTPTPNYLRQASPDRGKYHDSCVGKYFSNFYNVWPFFISFWLCACA